MEVCVFCEVSIDLLSVVYMNRRPFVGPLVSSQYPESPATGRVYSSPPRQRMPANVKMVPHFQSAASCCGHSRHPPLPTLVKFTKTIPLSPKTFKLPFHLPIPWSSTSKFLDPYFQPPTSHHSYALIFMPLLPKGWVGQACESSNFAMLFLTPPQSSVSHCSPESPFRVLLLHLTSLYFSVSQGPHHVHACALIAVSASSLSDT